MNSEGGTFLNGVKILSEEFNLGDKISFSRFDFIFKEYEKIDLPPILDMVDPVNDFLEDPPIFEVKDDKVEENVKDTKNAWRFIDNLKQYWKSTSETNKNVIWKYLNTLVTLSEKYK